MPANDAVITVTGLSSTFGLGSSLCWYPDQYARSPFNVSIGCVVNSTGTQTYNVEHCFDYLGEFSSNFNGWISTASNVTWFQNTGITAATSNANGNYAFPVTAIRLNVTGGSSIGTVRMILNQAG